MNRDPMGLARPAAPNAHNPTALQPPPPNRSPMREETPSARAVGGKNLCPNGIAFTLPYGLFGDYHCLFSDFFVPFSYIFVLSLRLHVPFWA